MKAPLKPVDFVQAVLLRPRMYTETGSYYEAVAFLKGYLSGIQGGGRGHHSDAPWFEFLAWLPERVGISEGRVLVRWRERHEDDTRAVGTLLALYEEFLNTRDEAGAPPS
ncbi:hypothetical protein [Deinococcus pimensis]|uniref:hypothetical protein n=1 Tax=Deinococcus pimensis TaxID=309888 RepID=UPI0012F92192|nr:hypothetical protein [Deinococcus pimensis]